MSCKLRQWAQAAGEPNYGQSRANHKTTSTHQQALGFESAWGQNPGKKAQEQGIQGLCGQIMCAGPVLVSLHATFALGLVVPGCCYLPAACASPCPPLQLCIKWEPRAKAVFPVWVEKGALWSLLPAPACRQRVLHSHVAFSPPVQNRCQATHSSLFLGIKTWICWTKCEEEM